MGLVAKIATRGFLHPAALQLNQGVQPPDFKKKKKKFIYIKYFF